MGKSMENRSRFPQKIRHPTESTGLLRGHLPTSSRWRLRHMPWRTKQFVYCSLTIETFSVHFHMYNIYIYNILYNIYIYIIYIYIHIQLYIFRHLFPECNYGRVPKGFSACDFSGRPLAIGSTALPRTDGKRSRTKASRCGPNRVGYTWVCLKMACNVNPGLIKPG